MLDKRAQVLLKTLIERYIAEGQPVGSRTLSRHSGLDLSPATIRNVMADLEELGFIASPHTSAGRIPTPAGYRFFIDTLLVVKPLDSAAVHRLEDQLHPHNPQRAIQSASQLLSQLTQFAGVVMTPRRRALAFRQIEFLRLSEKRVLLIIVTQDGDVQNRVLFTERDYSPSELVSAANYLNQNYAGHSFEDVRQRLREELREIKQDMMHLMSAALDAGNRAIAEGNEPYVISGERNLLTVQDLSQDLRRLRQLFELFEHKTQLLQILDLSLRGQGVQVFIGGESGVSAPDDVAVVTAPYKVDGEVVGTVGVIGPSRMAYDRVVPVVDVTAKLLSSALSPALNGILLVNLGTPAAPTPEAVRAYLAEFLSDPRVVELPRWLWLPVLHGIVLRKRPAESARKYASIWTDEGSPLAVHTARQAALLREATGLPVAYAMRYGEPTVASALRKLPRKVRVVPLYPQYARSTTESVRDVTGRDVDFVEQFHDHPGYIAALAALVTELPDVLVMSFHGLPQRAVDRGDPYRDQCLRTARLLASALGLDERRYRVTFQSRFGPARWLQPYTSAVLAELGAARTKRVQVLCPGFVSDCLETLEEIALEGRDIFLAAGGGEFRALPCLNESPRWIEALAAIATASA